MEEFRKITGYENYSISNLGNVRNDITLKILKVQNHNDGYKQISLCSNGHKKVYKVHRLVAKEFLQESQQRRLIDHIDGNKANNAVENLRYATHNENNFNTGLKISNKSGVKGVSWDKHRNKWCARIQLNKRGYHLGYFDSLEDAKLTRQKKAKELFKEYINSCEI